MPQLTPPSFASSRPLLQRAKEVREQTLRVCTRSVQLIERAVTTMQGILTSRDKLVVARVTRAVVIAGPTAPGWLQDIVEMPLKPWMLLELAEEFHQLAEQSALPEVGAALHALGFRYRALAGGFDSTVVTSTSLH